MSIKVAHVVRQYYPSIGGMEDVVQNIARHQRDEHGHTPTVITLNRLFRNSDEVLEAKDNINGIDVIRLGYRGSSRYPLCPQILNHVADADVIHVHGIDFFFDYLAMTKPIHRTPLVASTHGGFFHTNFAPRLKKFYFNTVTRLSSSAYHKVIATSDNDGALFGDVVKSQKLDVIENGVNVEKYSNQGAATRTPTLIYFGRWSANKGLLETIALFKQLVAQQPEWRLIIAGREYDHTAAELRAQLQADQLSELVFLAPNPTDQELAALISQSSYFVCLSRHEGFGIAPIEAMSAGLMPVLSDIPPFRNLIEQANLGLIVDPAQPQSTVSALLQLHSGDAADYAEQRAQMQAFAQRYSWRHIADKYVKIYTDLVGL